MAINISENKKIISKFKLKSTLNISCPNKDGSYIINNDQENICNDYCPICCEGFKINDQIIYWTGCNHPYHSSCYKLLKCEHNITTCSICRTELKQVKYEKNMSYLFLNDYDSDSEEETIKYNDVSEIYKDNNGNLTIRFKIFCKKYNFAKDEYRFNSIYLKNVSVLKLVELISLASYSKTDEIQQIILSLMSNYVIIDDIDLGKNNYNIIMNDLKKISEIFRITDEKGGYIQLETFVEKIIDKSISRLISCSKKNIISKLLKFIKSTQGMTWFILNNLNTRKKFYQDNLAKVGGEKYRKVFNSENINIFIDQVNSFL